MKELDDAINKMFKFQTQANQYKEYICQDIFKSIITQDIHPDLFHSSMALTSIISHLVNQKLKYVNLVISSQLSTLSFLNTYDDKYLSNMSTMLQGNTAVENFFVEHLLEEIDYLIKFLTQTLNKIKLIGGNINEQGN